MMTALAIASFLALLLALGLLMQLLRRTRDQDSSAAVVQSNERLESVVRDEFSRNRQESGNGARELRDEVARNLKGATDSLVKSVAELSHAQSRHLGEFSKRLIENGTATDARLDTLRKALDDRLATLQEATTHSLHGIRTAADDSAKAQRQELGSQIAKLSENNERKLTELRGTVEAKLGHIQSDNAMKLEEMRKTVDEKLQSTLETRLGKSFQLVSQQLEQVHKGLGEMQSLANGVGDLKRVLTNVKTRGTWGEVQLGNLLEQILSPEQYEKNVATRPGSADRVEFAIRLPGPEGKEGQVVWLPIDAKFPVEDYERLAKAADSGDQAGIDQAVKALENRLRMEAQSIKDKYLEPPHTTDFALLFLPTEGLYAEVLRRPGLVERMQREQRVVIAGPTTLAALLNSLQMGFRTLAIQQRSSEVWQVLGAVKTEFHKFGDVIDKVKKKLEEASNAVDSASVRSRAITRKLRSVEELPATQAAQLLGSADATIGDDSEWEEARESARRA
ncbi:MAG: DNA recombination protein RmuC [Planctomycetota bacterium]